MKNLNITMPISMNKKYRTKSGSDVTLLSINAPLNGAYKIVGVVNNGLFRWSHTGSCSSGAMFDLVEVSEYEDFKIDDPVMVRDDDTEEWVRRHFAGVTNEGVALCWYGASTSWTVDADEEKITWWQCRKPTAEELKGNK